MRLHHWDIDVLHPSPELRDHPTLRKMATATSLEFHRETLCLMGKTCGFQSLGALCFDMLETKTYNSTGKHPDELRFKKTEDKTNIGNYCSF